MLEQNGWLAAGKHWISRFKISTLKVYTFYAAVTRKDLDVVSGGVVFSPKTR